MGYLDFVRLEALEGLTSSLSVSLTATDGEKVLHDVVQAQQDKALRLPHSTENELLAYLLYPHYSHEALTDRDVEIYSELNNRLILFPQSWEARLLLNTHIKGKDILDSVYRYAFKFFHGIKNIDTSRESQKKEALGLVEVFSNLYEVMYSLPDSLGCDNYIQPIENDPTLQNILREYACISNRDWMISAFNASRYAAHSTHENHRILSLDTSTHKKTGNHA